MKNILIILLLFICTLNIYSQNRKKLLEKIKQEQDSISLTSKFNTNLPKLKRKIDSIYYTKKFEKIMDTNSILVFKKQVNYSYYNSSYSNDSKNYQKNKYALQNQAFSDGKRETHKKKSYFLFHYIFINKEPNSLYFDLKLINSNKFKKELLISNQNKIKTNDDELFFLKRKLYRIFYSKNLPLSKELIAEISNYNKHQKKESKRIIKGVDY